MQRFILAASVVVFVFAAFVPALLAGERIVWQETATERIKVKLVDGREVGRWTFPKKLVEKDDGAAVAPPVLEVPPSFRGMTEAELVDALGEPTGKTKVGSQDYWKYDAARIRIQYGRATDITGSDAPLAARWRLRNRSKGYGDVAKAPTLPMPTSTPRSVTPSYTPVRSTPAYSPSYTGGGSVHVRGHYRKNGTYVQPHTRRAPRR